jgi:hypothetical protein
LGQIVQAKRGGFVVHLAPAALTAQQTTTQHMTKMFAGLAGGTMAKFGDLADRVFGFYQEFTNSQADRMRHQFQAFGGFLQFLIIQHNLWFGRFHGVNISECFDMSRVECERFGFLPGRQSPALKPSGNK